MSETSNNILVRDLTPNQLQLLENYQKNQGISTRSKAVLNLIETAKINLEKIEELDELVRQLTSELGHVKNETRNFISSFNRLSSF